MGLAWRLDVAVVVVVAAVRDGTAVVEATTPVASAVPIKFRRLKYMIGFLESC